MDGPTPSSLFYPASGMPLASAMFGVSLTSYIAMGVVRICINVCIYIMCVRAWMGASVLASFSLAYAYTNLSLGRNCAYAHSSSFVIRLRCVCVYVIYRMYVSM